MTAALDGSDLRILVTGRPEGFNDGIAFDPVSRRLFWTNMGLPTVDDGFIQSVALDGSDLKLVAPPGAAFTPKQLKIDVPGRRLYWSDREGMRVMRSAIDGSAIEVLVQTGSGDAERKDASRWCVGIAIDPMRGHVYWTQNGRRQRGEGGQSRGRPRCRPARRRPPAPTSRCCSPACRNRSTWTSITPSAASTDRVETQSPARSLDSAAFDPAAPSDRHPSWSAAYARPRRRPAIAAGAAKVLHLAGRRGGDGRHGRLRREGPAAGPGSTLTADRSLPRP